MGASKRLSELCMQGIYNISKNCVTHFSIVRFGNVLESSGSVIPKFKKQISQGGPITITDKRMIRYFMTIQEAEQLVIQSVTLAKGNDIFILDMGKPIKIIDLAKKMISLKGDLIVGEKSIPILLGIKNSKYVIFFMMLSSIIAILSLLPIVIKNAFSIYFVISLFMITFNIYLLHHAKNAKNYQLINTCYKLILGLAIFSIVLY